MAGKTQRTSATKHVENRSDRAPRTQKSSTNSDEDSSYGLLILCVCRANVARSFFAQEYLKRALVREGLDPSEFEVISRGTSVRRTDGEPSEIGRVVPELAAEANKHIPTQVEKPDLERANLILVAEKSLEEALCEIYPPSARITFTLVEFGLLVTDQTVQSALPAKFGDEQGDQMPEVNRLIENLSYYRGYLAFTEESEDIADPAGKTLDHLLSTSQTIEKWVNQIAKGLIRR